MYLDLNDIVLRSNPFRLKFRDPRLELFQVEISSWGFLDPRLRLFRLKYSGWHFLDLRLELFQIEFNIETGNNIRSSAGFIEINNELGIFFGSEDGSLYGIDIAGNNIDGWPVNVSELIGHDVKINASPVYQKIP